jgi:hypothetical protein
MDDLTSIHGYSVRHAVLAAPGGAAHATRTLR